MKTIYTIIEVNTTYTKDLNIFSSFSFILGSYADIKSAREHILEKANYYARQDSEYDIIIQRDKVTITEWIENNERYSRRTTTYEIQENTLF